MNIVCTKYGNLYDYSYVNHLYDMVLRNTTLDFKFWCQTEDPTGIDKNISIIEIKDVNPNKHRYHKISLIENDILKGNCISFDLDIIINKNIDHYLNHRSDKLTLLYANYKTIEEVKIKNSTRNMFKDSMLNSSIFSWDTDSQDIKKILKTHYSMYDDSHLGSFDRFLFWECAKNVAVFKFDDYTSYHVHGYNPEKTFCIFNSHRDKQIVKKFWS